MAPLTHFTLDKAAVAEVFIEEVSRDWSRVEKYVKLHKELERGKRTAVNALRILTLGCQLTAHGAIVDVAAANHYRDEMQYYFEKVSSCS